MPKKPGMPPEKPGMDPMGADDQGGIDQSSIDDIMGGTDSTEGADSLFPENPLEGALTAAGYKATPEQITQIEAILKPMAKPGLPGAKPPMPGAKPPMAGGAVPSAMGAGDLPTL
jgi:hypothetical protein